VLEALPTKKGGETISAAQVTGESPEKISKMGFGHKL
jgi:hypothetical protein